MPAATPWPALPASSWTDTRDTLHRWLQLVGKTALALKPMLNQWWQVPFQVTAQGLSTGAMPYGQGLCELIFDLRAHRLRLLTSDGCTRELVLEPRSVADFYRHYQALLREAGLEVRLWPAPVEVADATPFAADHHHHSYDPAPVATLWDILQRLTPLMQAFRGRFTGKCSPVQLFWGSFDLSVTRFSGRPAPPHPGGPPHLAQRVTDLAYTEEMSELGWWPGGNGQEAAFFSYAYPSPPGFEQAPVRPAAAHFDQQLGEFILPYEAARTTADPAQAIRDFMDSTYEAAATLAHWDRPSLERTAGFPT